MIPRQKHLAQLLDQLNTFPVVAMLGPRQVGKTTLARQLAEQWPGTVRHFDLEDPEDQARLSDPAFVLRPLCGLVVLDEIQTRPDLFPLLRVLADRPDHPARFLLLGSAAPELMRYTTESLAGRVIFHELDGLTLEEITTAQDHNNCLDERWLRGGFPRSLLAKSENKSRTWREAFIRTYLERDLPQLGINLPAITLRRFWTMLAVTSRDKPRESSRPVLSETGGCPRLLEENRSPEAAWDKVVKMDPSRFRCQDIGGQDNLEY